VPRPRRHSPAEVMEAAKNTFWERGYEATTVSDLEQATGLNRSSLYLHFGPKRALFARALDRYMETFVEPLVRGIVVPSPGLEGIMSFFSTVKALLLADPDLGRRGCLVVNAIACLPDSDAETEGRASAYRDLLRQAFVDALRGAAGRGEVEEAVIHRRAGMLAATTFGIWVSARIDPIDAAELCGAMVSEVRSWGPPPVPV
jgi:TetR/AcrR family transcriptional regulator, transcriptional repressor for nem operon